MTLWKKVLVLVVVLGMGLPGSASALSYLNTEGLIISPLLATVDAPANHVVTSGGFYDGVARVYVKFPELKDGEYVAGSASLLQSGGKQYLLTAAHLLTHTPSLPTTILAYFPGVTNPYTGVRYVVHPDWTSALETGIDLALIKLNAPVPAPAYDILRTEISGSTTGYLAGYGWSGMGGTGADPSQYDYGILRQGQNTFGEALWSFVGNPYAYDFDNYDSTRNTITRVYGIPSDLGVLGNNEAMTAHGDSGGPTFIDGKIAGVHSFGATYGMSWGDIDNVVNSTFGELGGDVRVAPEAAWILQNTAAAPVPGSACLLLSGLLGLLLLRRRPRSG